MVLDGYLPLLGDQRRLRAYWDRMLLDFPEHPAGAHPDRSFPLSLYGRLARGRQMVVGVWQEMKDERSVCCS